MSNNYRDTDLEFQNYLSSSSPQQTKAPAQGPSGSPNQVRVNIVDPGQASATTSNPTSNKGSFLSLLNLGGSAKSAEQAEVGDGATAGLSNETIQQLLWLSGKQKNKQQRESITSSSNWGLGYLAQYFDVTTMDVCERILWSAVPLRKSGLDLEELEQSAPLTNDADTNDTDRLAADSNFGVKRKKYSFIERFIQSRPDFYGPFWISATLIFAIAIFSNIVSYVNQSSRIKDISQMISNANQSEPSVQSKFSELALVNEMRANQWHYSVEELSMATSLVTFYVVLVPFLIWCLFKFHGCPKYYTLTEIICAYGYSLSIFIPVSALLTIQYLPVRYLVIALAALMSGSTLMLSMLPVVQSDTNKAAGSRFLLFLVPAGQFCLAYLIHRIMLQSPQATSGL